MPLQFLPGLLIPLGIWLAKKSGTEFYTEEKLASFVHKTEMCVGSLVRTSLACKSLPLLLPLFILAQFSSGAFFLIFPSIREIDSLQGESLVFFLFC